MSDTMMPFALLVLVSLVALGLGFVALIIRGGTMSLKAKAPGVEMKSRVETGRETDKATDPQAEN